MFLKKVPKLREKTSIPVKNTKSVAEFSDEKVVNPSRKMSLQIIRDVPSDIEKHYAVLNKLGEGFIYFNFFLNHIIMSGSFSTVFKGVSVCFFCNILFL